MFENSIYDSMASAPQQQQNRPGGRAGNRHFTVSARKLAATLWELQEIPVSRVPNTGTLIGSPQQPQMVEQQPHLQSLKTHGGATRRNTVMLPTAPSPASSHVSMRATRRPSVQYKLGDSNRKHPPGNKHTHLQVLKLLERARSVQYCQDPHLDTQEIKAENGTSMASDVPVDAKIPPADTSDGSTTSNELLKVLNRVWTLEEQHNATASVVASLEADLEGARARVKELTHERVLHHEAVESLTKKLADEQSKGQEREQEAIKMALQAVRKELEEERKSKRKLDLIHQKVTKELIEAKKSLMKALQDLAREQKARQLVEDVCDELAIEIGEDKAKVEQLKRESAKVREEVEEERKMLQVAEVWREERVHMKLAEARLEIEEKNTALDKLQTELEAFLKAKRACEAYDGVTSCKTGNKDSITARAGIDIKDIRDARLPNPQMLENENPNEINKLYTTDSLMMDVNHEGSCSSVDDGSVEGSGDDDDLHSIELNKDAFLDGAKGSPWGRTILMQQGSENIDRRPQGKASPVIEVLASQGSKQGQLNEKISNSQAEAASGECREIHETWVLKSESQWFDNKHNIDELRDWKMDRELPVESRVGRDLMNWKAEVKSPEEGFELNESQGANTWQSGNESLQSVTNARTSADLREGVTDKDTQNNVAAARTKERGRQGSIDHIIRNGDTEFENSQMNFEEAANALKYQKDGTWGLPSTADGVDDRVEASGVASIQKSANPPSISDALSAAKMPSSPTRQWGQWSGPDSGAQPVSRSATKASKEIPKASSKEIGTRGRLAEAKLNSQARLRIARGL